MTKQERKEYDKKYRSANKEKLRAKNKEYHETNKDKRRAQMKEYDAANKDKRKEYNKEYHETNKDNRREYNLLKKYGISLNDYNILFNKQNGCCKICGVNELLLKGSLCVDHCHSTGKVRGLLCKACNLMIGNAKDDINTLNSAIIYLTS